MNVRAFAAALVLPLVATLSGNHAAAQGFQLPQLVVTSDAFEDGGFVPLKYAGQKNCSQLSSSPMNPKIP